MNTTALKPPPTTPAAKPATAPKPVSRMALKNVRQGVMDVPHRVLIYGAEKVGKSTFAASAPKPIFLGKDSGTEHLDVARLPQPRNWAEVLEGLNVVLADDHSFETLVVDPVNWLEPLCHQEIVGTSGDSIEAWNGGFGRGYDAAVDKWRVVINLLERIWSKRKMNIVLCAHAQVKKFNDPEGPGYERYELEMANKRVSAALKQWVETILFCRREAYGKLDERSKKIKGAGSAARIMHTEWTPAFDAGNRWCLPAELPLSWREYVEAVAAGKERKTELLEQIEAALVELADQAVEKKVREYLGDPRVSVVEVWNQLSAKVGEKRQDDAVSATNVNQEGAAA